MCDACAGNKRLMSKEVPHVIWGHVCDEGNILEVFVDRGYLRLCSQGDSNCLDHGERVKIQYCPCCGKEL